MSAHDTRPVCGYCGQHDDDLAWVTRPPHGWAPVCFTCFDRSTKELQSRGFTAPMSFRMAAPHRRAA